MISIPNPALAALTIHCYRFILEVQPGPAVVTFEHKGSSLRGTLLRHLYARFCLQPFLCGAAACLPCRQPQACPIASLAGTEADNSNPDSARGDDLPRLFALEPELSARTVYQPGEHLSFGINLFGHANALFPYICGAVEAFDDHLSRSRADGVRGRLKLTKIVAEQPLSGVHELVWQLGSHLRPPNLGVNLVDVAAYTPTSSTGVTVLFKSPTTLKYQGQILRTAPPFVGFIQRLLDRIASLLGSVDDHPPRLPFSELLRLAREVRVTNPHDEALPVRWVDLEHYSSTQGQKHSIGGIVGRVCYQGELAPFIPWLVFGQWLHIGKNAVQGNGMYRVEEIR